jgi:LPS export ABC transporter permease LptG
MSILFRWLFQQGLWRVLGTLIVVLGIFIIVELFDKSRLLGHGMDAAILSEYLLLKIPYMSAELMPVVVLLGLSIFLVELSHHQEIAALRAAGVGLGGVLRPLLMVALCATLLSFVINEWVTPLTNQRLDTIERVNVHHQAVADAHGIQWLRDGLRMLRIRPLGDDVFAIMVLETDEAGRWLQRMDAAKAMYRDGSWQLQQVDVSHPDAKEGMLMQHLAQTSFSSSAGPDAAAPPQASHMRFLALLEYSNVLQQAGMSNGAYVFALHRKLTAPLACLVMALLAIALCMNMGSRLAARSFGLAAAIALGLMFYVLSNASGMLAGGERLPPSYAAWLPILFFGGVAGFLLMHRESLH